MIKRSALLVFSTILNLATQAQPHLGPVTDILMVDGEVYSSSQAGVLRGQEADLALIVRPDFRITSLGLCGKETGTQLLFAGGLPGEVGNLGSIGSTPGENESHHSFKVGVDLLYDLAISPDGKSFALAGADGRVDLGDIAALAQGKWTTRHGHTAAARAVAFSPDGKWLASAGLDGVIMISAVEEEPGEAPMQLLEHTSGIECLVWSPDSDRIATGSKDSKVRLHEVSGKLIRTYTGLGMENEPVAGRVPSRVLSLAWNKGALVAGTSKGSLYRLSQTDDTMEKINRSGTDPIYSLAFGIDRLLLIGGHSRLQTLQIDR